jgi:CheY-like chemotaxis protein
MTMAKWILLAEDNANDAELALRALSVNQAAGDVIVACDGAEALDCLHRRGAFEGRDPGNPAVVMLDLKMPKVDGLQALQQIKRDPRLRNIPVVMFTSSREETDVARSYHLGANAYVVKPVDYKQFISVVKDLRRYWVLINEPPPPQPERNIPSTAQLAAAV